jgi:putative transcriptional regulator
MIRLQLADRLGNRSLYWLAKETGIAYSTIHKLSRTNTQGISFVVLDKLCEALDCEPADLLVRIANGKKSKRIT